MHKTILLTGATDGIGLETAKMLVAEGHTLLIHGRNAEKLAAVEKTLVAIPNAGVIESYIADLSDMADVEKLADEVIAKHKSLDVLINNAGIFKVSNSTAASGLDIRFVVNTIAPYQLTKRLLPLLGTAGRVVNLSSAAQAPVNIDALAGRVQLDDMQAYSQSKLAITQWTRSMALTFKENGPMVVAVNPGSLLGSKMVKEGFGVEGGDLAIGANILCRAALSDEFTSASGKYFDNDSGQFAAPHPDGLDTQKIDAVVAAIEALIAA